MVPQRSTGGPTSGDTHWKLRYLFTIEIYKENAVLSNIALR